MKTKDIFHVQNCPVCSRQYIRNGKEACNQCLSKIKTGVIKLQNTVEECQAQFDWVNGIGEVKVIVDFLKYPQRPLGAYKSKSFDIEVTGMYPRVTSHENMREALIEYLGE